MTKPAEAEFHRYVAELDDLAKRIALEVSPPNVGGGVMLLAATRMIEHLAGHLDNTRSLQGKERLGATVEAA